MRLAGEVHQRPQRASQRTPAREPLPRAQPLRHGAPARNGRVHTIERRNTVSPPSGSQMARHHRGGAVGHRQLLGAGQQVAHEHGPRAPPPRRRLADELPRVDQPRGLAVEADPADVGPDEREDSTVPALVDQARDLRVRPRMGEEGPLEVRGEAGRRSALARAHDLLVELDHLREVLGLERPDMAHLGALTTRKMHSRATFRGRTLLREEFTMTLTEAGMQPLRQGNLCDMLLATAGHRPAVIDGDSVVTYSELASRALGSAGTLAELGVKPGDRVAILTRRGADAAAAFYGALAAGAVAVIVNELLRPRQVEYVLEHSGASVLLIERAILDRLPRPLVDGGDRDRERRTRQLVRLRTRAARARRRGPDRLHVGLDRPAEGGHALARQPLGGHRGGGLVPGTDRRATASPACFRSASTTASTSSSAPSRPARRWWSSARRWPPASSGRCASTRSPWSPACRRCGSSSSRSTPSAASPFRLCA